MKLQFIKIRSDHWHQCCVLWGSVVMDPQGSVEYFHWLTSHYKDADLCFISVFFQCLLGVGQEDTILVFARCVQS